MKKFTPFYLLLLLAFFSCKKDRLEKIDKKPAIYLSYFFEYGPTPKYGKRTAVGQPPTHLGAYFYESWDDGMGNFTTDSSSNLVPENGYKDGYWQINLSDFLNMAWYLFRLHHLGEKEDFGKIFA